MKKKSIAITIGCAAAAVTAGAAAYINSAYGLVSRRKSRLFAAKNKNRRSNIKSEDKLRQKRRELKSMELETVQAESYDGLTLTGHWYPAKDPRRILVCVHGWRGSWYGDFGSMAQSLNEQGSSLLLIEQRAHGSSEGKYICLGIQERYDVHRWVEYITERDSSSLPIYLFGISMGASTVLMASTLPLSSRVKGVIADCGFTDAITMTATVFKKDMGKLGTLAMPLVKVCSCINGIFAKCRYGSYSAIEAVAETTLPTLFIHGDADDFVPMYMTLENYEACTAPKELLIIPGAGHARSHETAPTEYEDKLKTFFEKYN